MFISPLSCKSLFLKLANTSRVQDTLKPHIVSFPPAYSSILLHLTLTHRPLPAFLVTNCCYYGDQISQHDQDQSRPGLYKAALQNQALLVPATTFHPRTFASIKRPQHSPLFFSTTTNFCQARQHVNDCTGFVNSTTNVELVHIRRKFILQLIPIID